MLVAAAPRPRLEIPVIAVSGDDQLEKELVPNLPWVQYATGSRGPADLRRVTAVCCRRSAFAIYLQSFIDESNPPYAEVAKLADAPA